MQDVGMNIEKYLNQRKMKRFKYLAPYLIGAFTWGNVTHSYLHNHLVPMIVFTILFVGGALLYIFNGDDN